MLLFVLYSKNLSTITDILPYFRKEIDRAKKKNMKYDFEWLLMVSKTYRLQLAAGANAGGSSKGSGTIKESPLLFTNEEEEFFHEQAELSFEYSVKAERDTMVGGEWDDEENEMEPLRTVMLIPAQKIPAIMEKLQQNLSLPGAAS